MSEINFHERRFILSRATGNGDAKEGTTVFDFRQEGDVISATYQGGAIKLGMFIAKVNEQNELDVRFQQITSAGEFKTGKCLSEIEVLPDSRLRLNETWEFTAEGEGGGKSVLEEVSA